jgi:hypothetical protein
LYINQSIPPRTRRHCGRWARGGPALSYTFSSYSHEIYSTWNAPVVTNTDSQRILELSLDAFLGISLAGPFSLELGGTAGVATNVAKTTVCGNTNYTGGLVGVEGGFAVHVGDKGQYLASIHGVVVTLPIIRCSYFSYADEIGAFHLYHEHDFETVGAVLRLGMFL